MFESGWRILRWEYGIWNKFTLIRRLIYHSAFFGMILPAVSVVLLQENGLIPELQPGPNFINILALVCYYLFYVWVTYMHVKWRERNISYCATLGDASMPDSILEYEGFEYKHLGNGCNATGTEVGWRMSPDLYFRCVDCGYLMNGATHQDDLCKCGKLFKDIGMGRFGSRLGDDAIEVYRRV